MLKFVYYFAHLMDSNHRLPGYEPGALSSELRCDEGTFLAQLGRVKLFGNFNALYRALTAAASSAPLVPSDAEGGSARVNEHAPQPLIPLNAHSPVDGTGVPWSVHH